MIMVGKALFTNSCDCLLRVTANKFDRFCRSISSIPSECAPITAVPAQLRATNGANKEPLVARLAQLKPDSHDVLDTCMRLVMKYILT